MKKLFLMLAMCLMIMSCACNDKKGEEQTVTDDTLAVKTELVVSNLISTDRQEMFINHGENYRWFETCMKLNNYLDEENDGSLEEVVNVFQAATQLDENSFDINVFKFQHFSDGTVAKDSVSGFWVEDQPLNDEEIKLTYEEAYERLMQANITKPHSKYVTLRKQVGPKDANAQYIFGNTHETVFVDVVTGDVSAINPAFGPDLNVPLGEWP